MEDQVSSFTARLKAAYVQGEGNETGDSVFKGDIQLVYMSPETTTSPKMERFECFQKNVVDLAVDEAHLLNKWCVCVCVCV